MAKLPKDVLCLGLPERYPDRSALKEELRKNKRTQGWDPRVANVFAQHGVVPDGASPGKAIRLATRPRLEWALYYDKQTPAQCYDRLTDVSVPFHAVTPSSPFAVPPKTFKADVAKMKQKTSVHWVPDATHQILYEKMDIFTEFVAAWLVEETGVITARL